MIFSFLSFLFDPTYLQSSTFIHFSFHFASSAYSFRSNQHNHTLLAPHTFTWSNLRLLICVSEPIMLLLIIPDDYKNRIPKIIFFFYPFPPSSVSCFPSVFIPYFSPIPFSPSPPFLYIHSTCAQLSLSPHSTFFPFLPSNTCLLSPRSHI
jgi:hypothetical protein